MTAEHVLSGAGGLWHFPTARIGHTDADAVPARFVITTVAVVQGIVELQFQEFDRRYHLFTPTPHPLLPQTII